MIVESTLTSKNQTTLPKAVVEILGVKPSDKLIYEIEDGKITVRAKTGRLADLAGKFAHFGRRPRKALPAEKMSDAVAEAVAGDFASKFDPPKNKRAAR